MQKQFLFYLVFVGYYVMALALDLNNDSLIETVSTYSIKYELEGRLEMNIIVWKKSIAYS